LTQYQPAIDSTKALHAEVGVTRIQMRIEAV